MIRREISNCDKNDPVTPMFIIGLSTSPIIFIISFIKLDINLLGNLVMSIVLSIGWVGICVILGMLYWIYTEIRDIYLSAKKEYENNKR